MRSHSREATVTPRRRGEAASYTYIRIHNYEWPRRKCLVKTTFQLLLGRNYIVKRTIWHRADAGLRLNACRQG